MPSRPVMVNFRFRTELPVVVRLGGRRWDIRLVDLPKGHCAVVASSGALGGDLIGGKHSFVSHALANGIAIPVGTLRYRLVCQLVAEDRAEFLEHKPNRLAGWLYE